MIDFLSIAIKSIHEFQTVMELDLIEMQKQNPDLLDTHMIITGSPNEDLRELSIKHWKMLSSNQYQSAIVEYWLIPKHYLSPPKYYNDLQIEA